MDHPNAGYVLIEAVVALALLALGVAIALGSITEAQQMQAANRFREETLAFAKSHLNSILTGVDRQLPPLEGRFENGASWRLSVEPIPFQNDNLGISRSADAIAIEAFDLRQRVLFTLRTVRLSAVPR